MGTNFTPTPKLTGHTRLLTHLPESPPPPSSTTSSPSRIYILRHGEALHNIHSGYPHRDPPLTEAGHSATQQIHLAIVPDLIVISPMTRTIQTALNAFPSLFHPESPPSSSQEQPHLPKIQIWPSLREAHPALCNQGLPRSLLIQKYPFLDFRECPEEWSSLPPHSIEEATLRAEQVRLRFKGLSAEYKNIVVVTHRGFIAFLVKGERLKVCEGRGYGFWTEGGDGDGEDEDGDGDGDGEEDGERGRFGVNVDTGMRQDFGPTVLVEVDGREMRHRRETGEM
jgi:broad specificity phosphatase PhoE